MGPLFPEISQSPISVPNIQPGAADRDVQEALCPQCHSHRDDEKNRLSTDSGLLGQGGSASPAGTPRGLQNFTADPAFSLIRSPAGWGQEASVHGRDQQ